MAAAAQTLASPKIDKVALAHLLLDAGLTPEEAVYMHAICGGESGYRIEAMNVDSQTGSEDYGLFQINEIHNPDMAQVYVPEYNVEIAVDIYRQQGYTAWVAYDNGHYQDFLEESDAAVTQAVDENAQEEES
jgi:hypothetical protein